MMKTYISALLVVLFAGAQMGLAQESLDDVFAQLDDVGAADDSASVQQTGSDVELGAVEAVEVAPVTVEPVVVEDVVVADVAASTTATVAISKQDALFNKGIRHYKAGEYDEAEATFEAMLANDGYDSRAMLYLKRTAQHIASKEQRKQATSRAVALAEVNKGWNLEPKTTVEVTDPTGEDEVSPDVLAKQAMEARLKSIIIPSLDFRDANINDVVSFLSETCRRLDAEGKGVNIVLIGMDGVEDAGMADESNITISIRDMSLFEALEYITEMAELKFEVQPRVVAIMPVNYVQVAMLKLVSYDIIPEVGENLESFSGDDSGGGVEDLFGDAPSSSGGGMSPVDVSKYFSIVEWPDGASAVYQPRFSKLFVKNTPKNIEAVEEILNDLEQQAINKRSQQVRIETKFIEFNEGAMQELGFDWTLYDDGQFGGFGLGSLDGGNQTYYRSGSGYDSANNNNGNGTLYGDPVSGAAIVGSYGDPAQGGQNLFGLSQRNNSTALESVATGVLSTMGGVPAGMVFGMDGSFPLDLTITAMEQDGTADILSSPEVTTKSGNEATLRVVEVHRYPQDFGVETGQRTAPVVTPQDWEEEDLGVVLKVTPVVDAEANTIDLDLLPVIKKFKGYDDYLVAYNAYAASGNNSDASAGDGSALFARMPFFEIRSVVTQVTVADGYTVGMGGLKNETTETFSDRVPLLGDIPYLGRLFRTEGSRSSKKSLTILVKATQVDDRGMTRQEREKVKKVAAN